jgi:acyl-coenzyme A thioesterase PaaI-like protein
LGLRFEQQADGSLTAEFQCSPAFQGYPDRLHGGVVAMLLDAGMTHCLFARNIAGLTARLSIRYNHGVMLGTSAMVRARIVDFEEPLYYLESEVRQNGHVCAVAKATFWNSAHGEPIDGINSESAETSNHRSP